MRERKWAGCVSLWPPDHRCIVEDFDECGTSKTVMIALAKYAPEHVVGDNTLEVWHVDPRGATAGSRFEFCFIGCARDFGARRPGK